MSVPSGVPQRGLGFRVLLSGGLAALFVTVVLAGVLAVIAAAPVGKESLYTADVSEIRTFQRACLDRHGPWVTGLAPTPDGGYKVTCWRLDD